MKKNVNQEFYDQKKCSKITKNAILDKQNPGKFITSSCDLLKRTMRKIEENNRIGKTRDLFKKIRDTKGTFHAKMGTIKDRNGVDLTESEDIKKRWQEYTEELYKKV